MEQEDLITPQELHALLGQQPAPLVVDVRSKEKYEAGHIPGARHIPRDDLLQVLLEPPINRSVVVYCDMENPGRSGSELAARMLREAGYTAQALQGGLPGWMNAGYEIENGYNGNGTLTKPIV